MVMQQGNIGIVGAGHLGLALARRLLACGFNPDRISISHRGNRQTLERLSQAGLTDNIATNRELAEKADLIFLAVKPSDIDSLSENASAPVFGRDTVVVSCVAGLKTAYLRRYLQHDVIRIMPSSPLTIEAGTAIAALFPDETVVADILSFMKFRIYRIPAEETFHLFTATVCLAAAFLFLRQNRRTFDEVEILDRFGNEYDRFAEIYDWVKGETPLLHTAVDINNYLARMATKGGITERILESLKEGDSLSVALQEGINRSLEISQSFV